MTVVEPLVSGKSALRSAELVKIPSSRPKVSAVIITYNEELNIRRTLSQLYWCDEIVIIDSYSTDNTIAICQDFGCKIFYRTFEGYGAQKCFAVSKANHDWVLCIDADEVLSGDLIHEILNTLNYNTGFAGYAFRMNLVFLDKEFLYGKESGRYFTRLFNKRLGGFTKDKVHESISIDGRVKKLPGIIKHYSYTSLHQYMEKFNRYSTYAAEIAFQKGKNKSLLVMLFALPYYFARYYLLERNFMNGVKGFYWSVLCTYYHFTKYAKLRELHLKRRVKIVR
jgi:glycosyltransferase involved in cell wall biosynthesis